MPDKDAAAKDLVNHHFAVEPDLRAVYRILGEDETAAREPIKLLEINGATVATGTVEVFEFGPTKDTPYWVQIAEITPEEFDKLQNDPRTLPRGWDLGRAQKYERSEAAE